MSAAKRNTLSFGSPTQGVKPGSTGSPSLYQSVFRQDVQQSGTHYILKVLRQRVQRWQHLIRTIVKHKEVCESVDQTDTIRRWLAHMTDWKEMRTRIPYAVAMGSGQSLAAYETMEAECGLKAVAREHC